MRRRRRELLQSASGFLEQQVARAVAQGVVDVLEVVEVEEEDSAGAIGRDELAHRLL
nr:MULTISPECIES: hypothetical protein [unclassified Blastococcus]